MAEIYGANVASSTDRGVGAGAAQVLDTSPIEKQLQNQIAIQQRRQAALQQEQLNQLNKISLSGIRPGDQSNIQNQYNDVYQKYKHLSNLQAIGRDKGAIIQADNDFEQSKRDLQSSISGSVTDNKQDQMKMQTLLANGDKFDDGVQSDFSKSLSLPRNDPNYLKYSDLSNFTRAPKPVDLDKIADDAAIKTFTKNNGSVDANGKPTGPNIINKGGDKFQVTSQHLDFAPYAAAIKLETLNDKDATAAINKTYDPNTIDPAAKQKLEQFAGKPLNTPLELYAVDSYLMKKEHYNQAQYQHISEPKSSGNINFDFGQPTDPGQKTVINVGARYIDHTGKLAVAVKPSSTLGSFQFKPVKFSTAITPDIKNASDGSTIKGAGNLDIYGSEITSVPVYKSGTTNNSGQDIGGTIIPDDDLDHAKSKGAAQYKVMLHAQHGNVKGITPDGDYILSKDANPVYTPFSNTALTVLKQNTPVKQQAALAKALSDIYTKTSQANKDLLTGHSELKNSVTSPNQSTKKKKLGSW